MYDNLPPDITIEDARSIIAHLNGQVARLTDENQGLYQYIKTLDAASADLIEQINASREHSANAQDFWNEWGDALENMTDRNVELEAENVMLRRSRGSGVGRGRPANWTEGQAQTVRDLKSSGESFRRIADQVGLTLSQVQTILKPKSVPAVTHESREDRLARRALEIDRFIAAVKHQKKLAARRAAAKGRRKVD